MLSEAKQLLSQDAQIRDGLQPSYAYLLARAQVYATLYVGHQIERLVETIKK